jgi:TetR/AcrR family transcriptional regulator
VRTPRRSPAPEERQADAERSRRQLLSAAFDEFAAKGYAGARVQEIAAKAGVNKQLINYYFGGKEGLYRELQKQWLAQEATFDDHERTAAEVMLAYWHHALEDPRGIRLMAWRGLAYAAGESTPDEEPHQDLSGITDRQSTGELDPELNPGCLLLAMTGMITAPLIMPDLVRKVFGVDPTDPAFEKCYAEHLQAIADRLRPPADQAGTGVSTSTDLPATDS